MSTDPKAPKTGSDSRVAFRLLGLVAVMLGLSFAAVPFYDWFCRVTGFGGITNVAESASTQILDETVQIRFDANTERGMPWEFRPLEREMTIRLGENGLAFYEAYNPTDKPVAGTASFNVTPYSAGNYFVKVECFCFTEQLLMPGERVEMPVSFYVDPEILEDREAALAPTITLSYTFHLSELPEDLEVTQMTESDTSSTLAN